METQVTDKAYELERALVAVFFQEMNAQINEGKWRSQNHFLTSNFPDVKGINIYFIQLVRGRGPSVVPRLNIERAEKFARALGTELVLCLVQARNMLEKKEFPFEDVALYQSIADNTVGRPPKNS